MSSVSKIDESGHHGMVGSAFVRQLLQSCINPASIIFKTHAELDHSQDAAVQTFNATEKPIQGYLAAGKVSGIHAKDASPVDFTYQPESL